MNAQTMRSEHLFGLSVLDGCTSARPGETVTFAFAVRNESAAETPAATLVLALPPPWTALDPCDVALAPLPAGDAHRVLVRACAGDVDDAMTTTVQAELHVAGRIFGSNRVTVRVAGQPSFRGSGSDIAIEADGPDTFAVGVRVRNDGDAPARDVSIVAPVPPGFVGIDAPTDVTRALLQPGEAMAFSYRIAPVAALPASVCIDDAYVVYAGLRCALPTTVPLEALPVIALPELRLERRATRLDIRIRVANDGWTAAYDVPCTLAVPPGWRIARGSLLVDDGFAAVRATGEALAFVVPFLAPRAAAEIVAVATTSRASGGDVVITAAGGCVTQALPDDVSESVLIDACVASAYAEPGASVAVDVALRTGNRCAGVQLALDGTLCWSGDVRAGAVVRVPLRFVMPATCADGETLTVVVHARDAHAAVLAEASFMIRAVDYGAIIARNAERLALCAETRASHVDADAELRAPAVAETGDVVTIQVHVNSADALRSLAVRTHALHGATYVAGSTRVNGCAVIDGANGSPLFRGAGLAVYDVPAATGISVSWSIVPHRSGEHVLTADVTVDGAVLDVAPLTITIADALPFGARSHALPFHIDAPTVHVPRMSTVSDVRTDVVALPPPPEPSAPDAFALLYHPRGITSALALDTPRCAAIARVLCGSRGPGIVGHLPALAALFPSAIASGDPERDAGFAALARSVCGIYERLFVKLRIPGYDVTAADLDDAATRRALLALFAQLDGAPGVGDAADERTRITVTITHEHIANARAKLAAAPDDAPYALAAIALLLPRTATSGVAGAIGSYAALLADALAAACTQPASAIVAALCSHDARELDAARAVAIAVLGAVSEPATL